MPLIHLESVFRAAAGEVGSKVACETIALPGCSDAGGQCDASARAHANDADAPAESRLVRIGAGWSELAGAVLEREDSTKGSSNPKAAAASSSRKGKRDGGPRRLLTGKAAIVIGGLPAGKIVAQKRRSPCLGRGWRRPAAGARVFASEAMETEPGSPKVSCFGAVRSESRAATATATAPAPSEEEARSSGCWASVAAVLHHLFRSNNQRDSGLDTSETKATAQASPTCTALSPPRPVVVGLGDMKRLASRRWPETIGTSLGLNPVHPRTTDN
ncbi:hypothetical protein ABZP36_007349 [Zizania latifolia]